MKIIGTRKPPPITEEVKPPTPEQRAWIRRMAGKSTGAPKGVFRYGSIEKANQDREKWNASVVTEQVKILDKKSDVLQQQNDNQYCRPANWEDVLNICKLLNEQQTKYILVGGYALAAHGYVRMTQDIDIAVSHEEQNSKRWARALSNLPDQVTLELLAEKDPFQGDYIHAIRINDEFTIDILPSVAGISYEELQKYRQILKVEGIEIPILSLHGLLKTKQGLRPKDQADKSLIQQAIQNIKVKK